ncbi:hypothetical protein BHE89_15255 [Shigella sp. FC1967]|nr:hypothetical protein BHE89_15255 [Shigella sp. FC1967]
MISYLPRLPEAGESLLSNKFIFSPGGKGCNQALAASYADAQVHFITKIGTDQFSDYAVNFISSSRIKNINDISNRKLSNRNCIYFCFGREWGKYYFYLLWF